MKIKKKYIIALRRIFYILLPIIILYIIFRRINFQLLIENLRNANPFIIFLGISLKPLQIIIGAFRWKIINTFFTRIKLKDKYLLNLYWTGLAIGYFTPGSIGWDAYRIMMIGNKLGNYLSSFITIIVEKFIGLFSILLMILITFLLVFQKLQKHTDTFETLYLVSLISFLLALLLLLLFMRKGKAFYKSNLYLTSKKIIAKLINIIKNKELIQKIKNDYHDTPNIFSIIYKKCTIINTLLLSFAISIIAAIGNQIIFAGLGYDINFFINLFVAPVLLIIFIVPVSFGSIGVREGAFILIYGLFGVPAEVALLVSFFNLFGLFLNNIIGGIFILRNGIKFNQVKSGSE